MKKKLLQIPAVFILLCVLLSSFRVFWQWEMRYLFLVWNLFLAWLPFKLSQQLKPDRQLLITLPLCALVVLFLPNAPYLLTDMVHFRSPHVKPTLWFDLVLFFTYSITGLTLTLFTIDQLSTFTRTFLKPKRSAIITLLLFPAMGYGIYLGRIERINSWDAVLHPFSFAAKVWSTLLGSDALTVISFSLSFGLFIWTMYFIFNRLTLNNVQSSS